MANSKDAKKNENNHDKKIKILSVVGARPNFVKIAPFLRELSKHNAFESILLHTGQHYDYLMSESFFESLDIPKPDYNLEVGSGSHTDQTAKIMLGFEKVCEKEKPDLVVVVGDVNSTIACALVARKLGVAVAHIEAGLRSFDETMPEEINRILTDRISNLLFVSEQSGLENLRKEGVDPKKIFFTGNIMIDSLVYALNKTKKVKSGLAVPKGAYFVVTLHRPSNVDSKERLTEILDILDKAAERGAVIWPIHPRTRKNIISFGLETRLKRFTVLEPMKYIEFIHNVNGSKAVITDSGGIQEETTYLGIKCITMRKNTERPSTITEGTNILANTQKEILDALDRPTKKGKVPKYWDGHTAERIVNVLKSWKK